MKKVLIRIPNWLGDTVMALPLIQGLIQSRQFRISITAPKSCLTILEKEPGIDQFFPITPHIPFWIQKKWRKSITSWGAESIILLPTSLSSALLACFAKIPERIGYTSEARTLLLTRSIKYNKKIYRLSHLTRNYVALGKLLTGDEIEYPEQPFFTDLIKYKEKSSILLFPGAIYGAAKRWQLKNFAELSKRIQKQFENPIFIMGKSNECINPGIEWATKATNLVGKTTIRQFLDHIAKAALVIGNDSGAVHVAAAMKKPTIALFGSTSPEWTAPLGSHVRIVKTNVDCSPCYRSRCPEQFNYRCWQDLTVDKVWETVVELLG